MSSWETFHCKILIKKCPLSEVLSFKIADKRKPGWALGKKPDRMRTRLPTPEITVLRNHSVGSDGGTVPPMSHLPHRTFVSPCSEEAARIRRPSGEIRAVTS